MFTSNKRNNETVRLAAKDLRMFFRYDVERSDNYRTIWHRTREEIVQFDPTFESIAFTDDVAAFTEELLLWSEDRKLKAQLPWIIKKEITIDKSTWSFEYLLLIKNWLEEFGPIKTVFDPTTDIKQRSGKTIRFAQFVAKETISNQKWDLLFHRKGKEEDLKGFASWLVVNPQDHTLVVLYDEDLVRSSSPDTNIAADRLQKVFLHELGHVRMHFGLYLKEKETVSPSTHEVESWLYALTVMGLIRGMKSRICHLLDMSLVEEWY